MPKKIITRVVLFAAILAAVVLVLWLNNARQTRAAGTVLLSNGKSVYIGQSKAKLLKDMGSYLNVSGANYIYLGGTSSGEVVIFLKDDRVNAFRIIAGRDNVQSATRVAIGTYINQLEVKTGLKPVYDGDEITGYLFRQGELVSYYLIDPCAQNAKVLAVAVGLTGNEDEWRPAMESIEPCS